MAVTPASEFRKANRKEVTLPSGRTVMLKKLSGDFLFVIQELAEKSLAQHEAGGVIKLSASDQKNYVYKLVETSVVDPKVVPVDKEPTEDQMWVTDFGSDLDPLVMAINEYNTDVLKVPFRPEKVGDSDPQIGDNVRGEPQPVASETA